MRKTHRFLLPPTSLRISLSLLTIMLTACTSRASSPAPDMSAALTQAVATAFAQLQPTSTPPSTETPTPSVTAIRTPPTLPPIFTTNALNALDTPHTYIQDSCQYLKAKWDPNNASPGTVVMVIMFHSISKGQAEDANQISAADFKKLMNDLHELGFTAINIQQLTDFLYNNSSIPHRSVLLVVDDRHFAEYFNDHFRPFHDRWGWPVVNAYIAKDERPDLWAENAALSAEGWVDYQAHGVIHNINMNDNSTDEFLTGELQGAINNLQKYMNKTPIAIVWPGGDFGIRPVQFARQFGYKLGFTVNPRGPVMFNWIPQADQPDPARPYSIPEGPVGDPLMTLPRYWDTDARGHLDTVSQIGEQATAFAGQNQATELEYYDIVCAPTLGPISAFVP